MADQLYLSYKLRGYTVFNMLRHYEKALRLFPFSKLAKNQLVLKVNAISFQEPPVLERPFEYPPDLDAILAAAKEFQSEDCGVEISTHWELWDYDNNEWQLTPVRVSIACFAPAFDDRAGDDLRIELGPDARFLPEPDVPNSTFMAQSNIRSLLHLVGELDKNLAVESRRLWSESGENFAEKLAMIAHSDLQ